jgi:hypothetical protein
MFITNLFILYQAINKIGHVVTAKRAPEVCGALHASLFFSLELVVIGISRV